MFTQKFLQIFRKQNLLIFALFASSINSATINTAVNIDNDSNNILINLNHRQISGIDNINTDSKLKNKLGSLNTLNSNLRNNQRKRKPSNTKYENEFGEANLTEPFKTDLGLSGRGGLDVYSKLGGGISTTVSQNSRIKDRVRERNSSRNRKKDRKNRLRNRTKIDRKREERRKGQDSSRKRDKKRNKNRNKNRDRKNHRDRKNQDRKKESCSCPQLYKNGKRVLNPKCEIYGNVKAKPCDIGFLCRPMCFDKNRGICRMAQHGVVNERFIVHGLREVELIWGRKNVPCGQISCHA